MPRGKHTTAAYWQEHFASQSTSGLNTTDYIRQEGIGSSQWYYWSKKLRHNSHSVTTLIPITVQSPVPSPQTVCVKLPNGIASALVKWILSRSLCKPCMGYLPDVSCRGNTEYNLSVSGAGGFQKRHSNAIDSGRKCVKAKIDERAVVCVSQPGA